MHLKTLPASTLHPVLNLFPCFIFVTAAPHPKYQNLYLTAETAIKNTIDCVAQTTEIYFSLFWSQSPVFRCWSFGFWWELTGLHVDTFWLYPYGGEKKECAYSLVCLLIRITILLYQGSTLTTSFHLNYLLIGSFSKCSHVGS